MSASPPESGHRSQRSASPLGATTGLMHRSNKGVLFDHPIDASVPRLFRQPRFPKTLNKHLQVFIPASSDQRRDCKGGIELKQTRRRFTGLRITSEMGESGRETAVSCRIRGVLTLGLLPCDDGLVKASKLNQGKPYPSKRPV